MKAMPGRPIIKRDKFDHKIGSIVLPSGGAHKAKEGSRLGTVIAVNKDVNPHNLKKGDRVMFTKFAGNTVEIEGQEVYICEEKLILAVIED